MVWLCEAKGAYDVAFGLRSGGEAKGDAVEVESLTQLGEDLWVMV